MLCEDYRRYFTHLLIVTTKALAVATYIICAQLNDNLSLSVIEHCTTNIRSDPGSLSTECPSLSIIDDCTANISSDPGSWLRSDPREYLSRREQLQRVK